MSVKIRRKKCKGGYVSIYLDKHYLGVRTYEYLGIKYKERPSNFREKEDKKDLEEYAKRIALMRQQEMLNGYYNLDTKKKTDADFFAFCESFIDENKQIVDIRGYRAVLKKAKEFTGKSKFFCQDLTPAFLEKFVKYLSNNLSGVSPHNYFKKFRRLIRTAYKAGVLNNDIGADVSCSKGVSSVKDVLSAKEARKLYETPCSNQQIKRAFLLSYVTGLRFCDVKSLQWKNVHDEYINIIQNKTSRPVRIDLNKDSVEFLGKRENSNDFVFQLPSHTGCAKQLRKWVKEAGIKKHITWHCARHSFGTNLVHSGASILTTSKLLGHSNVAQTETYLRIDSRQTKAAIEKLPLITKNENK